MNLINRFCVAIMSRGQGYSEALGPRYWGFFLAATIVASGFARSVYRKFNLSQQYSELIVGSVAWSYENKFHDYAVLYAFVFAFLFVIFAVAFIAERLKKTAGVGEVERMHDFLLVLCAPAILWFSSLLTSRGTSLALLNISVVLLCLGLCLAALLLFKGKKFWLHQPYCFGDVLQSVVLFVVLACLSVAAVAVAENRLAGVFNWQDGLRSAATWRSMSIVTVCAAGLGSGLIFYARDPVDLKLIMRRALIGIQIFMPLFLLCVIPTAWIKPPDVSLLSGYELSLLGKSVVFLAIAVAYIEIIFKIKDRATDMSALRTLTVGSALGLLLFLKTPPQSIPFLMSDDYHFGELLVPWWSWSEMGMLPFWEYAPARGLLNYFPGLLAATLFDGAGANIGITYPFIFAALGVVAIVAMRPMMGVAGAFVSLLLGPYANGIGEIDIAVTIFMMAFCWGWLRWRSEKWLAAFAVAGVLILLYAPGQGALALMAFSPLAVGKLWTLYKADQRKFAYTLAAIFGVLGAFLVLTPLGKMFFGAIRYGAEQSQLNSVAHGIEWSASFGADPVSPWAFEIARTSFILVALWAGVLMVKSVLSVESSARQQIIVYALPVFIVVLLFVIRAAGRIDPGGSRLGIASAWALAMLLPMLLYASVRVRGVHFLIWVGLAGTLIPQIGTASLAGYVANLSGNFDPPDATVLEKARASSALDDARIGLLLADPAHLLRIVEVKQVLDHILEANETYLDLTGRHAMYYYVNRKPALESASMYNLVGEKQQLRAIASIRKGNFPAILLSADNIIHDGGPSSLRSNLVYREVLLSKGYKLATVGKQIWMVRADRIARLATGEGSSLIDLGSVEALSVLEPVYHQKDLRGVPASWGRSVASLEKELSVPVLKVDSAAPSGFSGVRVLGNGSYAIEGSDPHVRFDISESALSGRQAGVLSFDFSCEQPSAAPMVGIYWSAPGVPESEMTFLTFRGHQGRLLVPIDSAPSWLLAGKLNTLRFDIDGDSTGCQKFTLRNVELLARNATLQH